MEMSPMKGKYSLKKLLSEDAGLEDAAAAGVQATMKGKPEQEVMRAFLAEKLPAGYELIGTTKMGNGPDVLFRGPDGKLYELEVKSAGGSKDTFSPEKAITKKIESGFSFMPSGSTDSKALSELGEKVGKATDLAAKITAIKKHFSSKIETLTSGHVGQIKYASEELKKEFEGYAGQNFVTTHIAHVALGKAALIKLSDAGPDIDGQVKIDSAKKITAATKGGNYRGISKIQFDVSEVGLLSTDQESVWQSEFPGALDAAISTMAAKPSWGLFLDHLAKEPISDDERSLLISKASSLGVVVPEESASSKEVDWSGFLVKMCTTWGTWTTGDLGLPGNKASLMQQKRAGYLGEDTNLPVGTLFWTCTYDNLVCVPYLPKDVEKGGRLGKLREIFFKCLRTGSPGEIISSQVESTFKSNLRVATDEDGNIIVGTAKKGADSGLVADGDATLAGFFVLRAMVEGLAQVTSNGSLVYDSDCNIESITRSYVGSKYSKLSSESVATIQKFMAPEYNPFKAASVNRIFKNENVNELRELMVDIIANCPVGGGTSPVTPRFIKQLWSSLGTKSGARAPSPSASRDTSGFLSVLLDPDRQNGSFATKKTVKKPGADGSSLDHYEPAEGEDSGLVQNISNMTLDQLKNELPKMSTSRNKKAIGLFAFWQDMLTKLDRLVSFNEDGIIKRGLQVAAADGDATRLSRYDLFNLFGFQTEAKTFKKIYKMKLVDVLLENENEQDFDLEVDLIDVVDGVDSVEDAAAFALKGSSGVGAGVDQIVSKMEQIGKLALTGDSEDEEEDEEV